MVQKQQTRDAAQIQTHWILFVRLSLVRVQTFSAVKGLM